MTASNALSPLSAAPAVAVPNVAAAMPAMASALTVDLIMLRVPFVLLRVGVDAACTVQPAAGGRRPE